MPLIDFLAYSTVFLIFAFIFLLPVYVAYRTLGRWKVWIIPSIFFGPLVYPFIYLKKRNQNKKRLTKIASMNLNENSTSSEMVTESEFASTSTNSSHRTNLLISEAKHRGRKGTLVLTETSISFNGSDKSDSNFTFQNSEIKCLIRSPYDVQILKPDNKVISVNMKKKDRAKFYNYLTETRFTVVSMKEYILNSNSQMNEKFSVSDKDPLLSKESLPSEVIEFDNSSDEKIVTQGATILGKPSMSLKVSFLFSGSRKLKQLQNEYQSLKNSLANLAEAKLEFLNFENLIATAQAVGSPSEKSLFEVGNCRLIEVRKGARVTHRESSYSGSGSGGSVGFAGVRVGGGSYRGSSSSTTISYPAPDILQVIDSGKFIMTNKKVSFVGGMFTKSTAFSKIVDYQSSGLQTLVAPASGSKVWICEFPQIEWQWLSSCLLSAVFGTENRLLDSKGTTEYGDLESLIKSEFSRTKFEIDLTIEEYSSEIEAVKAGLSKLEVKYGKLPAWVRKKNYE